MKFENAIYAFLLGVVTTALVFFLDWAYFWHSIFWSHEFYQVHRGRFVFAGLALPGFAICLCLSIILDCLRVGAIMRTASVFAAVAAVVIVFPILAMEYHYDGGYAELSALGLLLAESTVMWFLILRKRKPGARGLQ
ncbi:MAG TPA: hypothetical protein VMZ92_12395 [Planctomycetota bacterium]|nr:hypothetical protein [Planctomycetota bacterium]